MDNFSDKSQSFDPDFEFDAPQYYNFLEGSDPDKHVDNWFDLSSSRTPSKAVIKKDSLLFSDIPKPSIHDNNTSSINVIENMNIINKEENAVSKKINQPPPSKIRVCKPPKPIGPKPNRMIKSENGVTFSKPNKKPEVIPNLNQTARIQAARKRLGNRVTQPKTPNLMKHPQRKQYYTTEEMQLQKIQQEIAEIDHLRKLNEKSLQSKYLKPTTETYLPVRSIKPLTQPQEFQFHDETLYKKKHPTQIQPASPFVSLASKVLKFERQQQKVLTKSRLDKISSKPAPLTCPKSPNLTKPRSDRHYGKVMNNKNIQPQTKPRQKESNKLTQFKPFNLSISNYSSRIKTEANQDKVQNKVKRIHTIYNKSTVPLSPKFASKIFKNRSNESNNNPPIKGQAKPHLALRKKPVVFSKSVKANEEVDINAEVHSYDKLHTYDDINKLIPPSSPLHAKKDAVIAFQNKMAEMIANESEQFENFKACLTSNISTPKKDIQLSPRRLNSTSKLQDTHSLIMKSEMSNHTPKNPIFQIPIPKKYDKENLENNNEILGSKMVKKLFNTKSSMLSSGLNEEIREDICL